VGRNSAQVGGDAVAPIRRTDRDFPHLPSRRRALERAARKRQRPRSTTTEKTS
jgi:hypothetical protein